MKCPLLTSYVIYLIIPLKIFLSNRSIKVEVDEISSSSFNTNAEVPQGSVISPTLFIIYINDLLNLPSNPIHCYADDNTLHNPQSLLNNRANIASSINLDLSRLKNWGSQNLVSFNAGKTQCCLISRRVDRDLPDISIDSSSLEFRDKLSMLGVTLGSDLSWNDYFISVAKAAACKHGFLFRTKRFFTPTQLLPLYKAPIRPCLEYCSHLWRGASKHSFNTYLGCNPEAGYQTDRRPCIN